MARIRSIHPGLASDEVFMSMTMAAKAAWGLLWTECDDHGIFEWKPIVLKARIFPADNVDFTAILDEYERLGCVKRREIDGKPYGLVRNFCRYQRPKNPSYRYGLPEDETEYVGLKPSNPPGLPQDSPSPTENLPQRKEEGGRREEVGGKERTSLRSDARANGLELSGEEPAVKKPRRAPSILADDFALTEALREFANVRGYPGQICDRLFERFCEHAKAKGLKYTDWAAAWRTWVLNQVEFDSRRPGSTGPPHPRPPDV